MNSDDGPQLAGKLASWMWDVKITKALGSKIVP